jgi:coenzyme F420-reducing hydrogenase beta subunit
MKDFKINIITPCFHPEHLKLMYDTMPQLEASNNFQWIIVFGSITPNNEILSQIKTFKNTIHYIVEPEKLKSNGDEIDILRKYAFDIIDLRNDNFDNFILYFDDEHFIIENFFSTIEHHIVNSNAKAILFRHYDEINPDNIDSLNLNLIQFVFNHKIFKNEQINNDNIKKIYFKYKDDIIIDNSWLIHHNEIKKIKNPTRNISFNRIDEILDGSNNHSFSVVTTCRGREKNLIEIIPSWCEHPLVKQMIIVDWTNDPPLITIPEFKELFNKYNKLEVIRINDQEYFNNGKSQNLGIRFVKEKMFIRVDSDCKLINDELLNKLSKLDTKYFISGSVSQYGLTGFIICETDKIQKIKGNREDFIGYGLEDLDLYERLQKLELNRYIIYDLPKYIYHIPHDTKSRTQFHLEKNMGEAAKKNFHIMITKLHSEHAQYEIISKMENDRYIVVKEINNKKNIDSFIAWTLNDEELINSSSGGIFYVLAKKFVFDKNYVCGSIFNDDFTELKHVLTNDLNIVKKMRGSKYAWSDISDGLFDEIKNKLISSKILFSGLPCQIHDLKYYLQQKDANLENLYTISLICHGAQEFKLLRSYLDELENMHNSKIININFRSKLDNFCWDHCAVKIDFKNGQSINEWFNHNSYISNFLCDKNLKPCCYQCKFKNIKNVNSDLIIGDAWGIKSENIELFNKNGTSIVIYLSEKGEKMLSSIMNNIFYARIDFEKIQKYNKLYYKD